MNLTIWEKIRIPLILIAGFLILLQTHNFLRKHQDSQVIIVHKDSTTYYKDALGREHAQSQLHEATLEQLKLIYGKQLADKAAELRVKEKRILGLTSFSTSRQLNVDSLLKLYGTVDTIHITRDTTIYVPRVQNVYVPLLDSLAITQYRKRVNWFKSKDMVDVISYYPDVKIRSVEGFTIKPRRNNLNIGPTLTWSLTPQGMRLVPGIGIQYSLVGVRIGR